MENKILRTSFRGYKKEDVLTRLNALNVLILAIEDNSISKADAEKEIEKIISMEMRTAFQGFNKEDTDKYINEMVEQIRNYR